MKITSAFFMAVSALVTFGGPARAADNILLAVNKPAKTEISIKASGLAAKATAQINAEAAVSDGFDAFNAVNDPLYREGSKEFLKQVSKQDSVTADKAEKSEKKTPVKAILRDAPNSQAPASVAEPVKVQPVLRKSKLMKVIPADPVKSNNTL